MPAALIAWLVSNWKLVLVGGLALAMAVYVETLRLEVGHYKGKAVTLQAQLDDAEHRKLVAESLAAQRAREITAAHADSLQKVNTALNERDKAIKDKISANEELKHVRLSLNLVQLWNASKQQPEAATPTAVQGNDGKTSTTEVTLNQLFTVSAENDKNHLKCVKQVEEWQAFWQEYVKAKEEIDAQVSRRSD